MANTFDQFDDTPSSSNPFDQFDKEPAKPSGALRDLGKSLKVGVQKLPGMVTGLADLPIALATGARPFTSAADAVGEATGFQPGKWADETQRSDDYKAGQANVNKAWAGVDAVQKDESASKLDYAKKLLSDAPAIAGEYLKNPMYTANQVVESVPGMLTGGVASKAIRGLGALAGKGISAEAAAAGAMGPVRNALPGYVERAVGDKWVNPVVGGIGEGAVTAGSAMDSSKGEDQRKNAIAALGAGVGTGAIGVLGGRVANSLGLETSATAMAKLGDGTLGNGLGATKRILGGAISEGAFQELPQSMQEAMWQNYVNGKPIMQGVARQGIEGALAGAVMGGGANVYNSGRPAAAKPAPEQPPAVPPEQPPVSPDATLALPPPNIIVGPDGSATTAQDRNERLARIQAGDVTDVTPIIKQSEQMGLTPTVAPSLTNAAITAVDTGVHQQQVDQQTSEADQAAYDAHMAEKDTATQPITHGKLAEAQMPPADLEATVYPPPDVLAAYEGTHVEDIFNGEYAPFSSEEAAQRRAKMEGSLWTVSAVYDGWVVRKKDANVSNTSPVQPVPATSSGQDGNKPTASVGSGASDANGVGANAGGLAPSAVDQSRQPAGGVPESAVTPKLTETKRRDYGDGHTGVEYSFGNGGTANVLVKPDGSAYLTDIILGDSESDSRGKGQGTAAYMELGRKLAEQGIKLESTRWSKHKSAIAPSALRIWQKLEAAGLARQTGFEEGKVYDRFSSNEAEVRQIPLYEFTAENTQVVQNNQAPANDTKAQAAPDQAPEAMAGDAAAPADVPGAGSVAVESVGVSLGERAIREQASVATSEYDSEKKLRFADFAESLAGQSETAIRKAIINSEFGASLAINELDFVSKSIAENASLVADQARKNAAPKAESTPAQKLEGQIKFQKLRVEQASDAIRSATDTDRFGLPVESGPKKQSAIKRHADAQQKLSELERELSEIGKQDASAANRAKLKAKNTPDSQTKEKPSVTQTDKAKPQQTQQQETPAAAGVDNKAKWIKAVADKNRLNGSTGVQLTVTSNGKLSFLGDPNSSKDGRALQATLDEALKAGATVAEIAAALNPPKNLQEGIAKVRAEKAKKPEIVVDKAEMRPYRKPDGSVGYEAVPIVEDTQEAEKPGTVNVPPTVAEAFTAQMQKQKGRITRLKNEAEKAGSLEDKKVAQVKVAEAESKLRTMRMRIFDAEDAAVKAVKSGYASAFDAFSETFPDAKQEIAKLTGQNDELDAEMRSYEAKKNPTYSGEPKPPQSPVDNAPVATESVAKPDDFDAMFDDVLAEEVAKDQAKTEKPKNLKQAIAKHRAAKAPRTAKKAATSAAKNVGSALSNAIDGLGALFGQTPNDDGTTDLNSGIPVKFNAETYAKAKPLFQAAIADMGEAGKDLKEAMRAVIRMVLDKFGAQAAVNMKPYVMRFIEDRALENSTDKADTDTKETKNDSGTEKQGSSALDGVPTGKVGTTGSGGSGGRGAKSGSTRRRKGNSSTDGKRGTPGRSGGDSSSDADSSSTGGTGRGRGIKGNGSGVSENGGSPDVKLDAGSGRGVSEGQDGLFTESGEVIPAAVPAVNFTITPDLKLGSGGEVTKYKDNIAAIRVLKLIESEHRRATAEEQRVLARYVGWGGLANAFRNRVTGAVKADWESEVAELESLLTAKELKAASASTPNAHYTSETVTSFMWRAAVRLGFSGGMALESSVGSGNFIGLMPEHARRGTYLTGIELDSITARIAGALYPQANIVHSPFEKVALPDNTFDLNIGNPPFGNISLRMQYNPKHNGKSIHNQFFLGGMDAIKPGGLQTMVVSRYLMDAQDASTREALALKAELLGAIRLPGSAFKGNAGTDVVTDILFLKKRSTAEQAELQDLWNSRGAKVPAKESYADRAERLAGQARLAQALDWTTTAKVPDPLGGEAMQISKYFADNPQMVAGVMDRSGSMQFGGDIDVKLPASELAAKLDSLMEFLPGIKGEFRSDEVNAKTEEMHRALGESMSIMASGREIGSIYYDEGGALTEIVERVGVDGKTIVSKNTIDANTPWSSQLSMNMEGKWFKEVAQLDEKGEKVKINVKVNPKTGKKTGRNVYIREVFANESDVPSGMRLGEEGFAKLKKLVGIRELYVEQINLETNSAQTGPMEANRDKLRAAYEAFVADHGYISEQKNAAIISEMPDEGLMLSLELKFRPAVTLSAAVKRGIKPSAARAEQNAILTRAVAIPPERKNNASSVSDAVAIVLGETGRIDVARVAELRSVTEDEALAELTGGDSPLAYMDPETNEVMEKNQYLSGNVRKKLVAARDAGLKRNVDALMKVQPEPWTSDKVTAHIGASWVPPEVYANFIKSLLGREATVTFSQLSNTFEVYAPGTTAIDTSKWGTGRLPAVDLLNDVLNSRRIAIYDGGGKDSPRVLNETETQSAIDKKKEIIEEFDNWIFKDGDRRQELTRLFNDKYNILVNRQYDGSHMDFPGKVPDSIIAFRRNQINAIWRGIVDRFTMYDHAVGAGKTFTGIARAMERKRMGLSNKPTIVVPNHLVSEWATQAYRLYPGAKILAAGAKDLEPKNRRRLFAKIAAGDWDIVIVPHSSFKFIGISPETEERFINDELRVAQDALKEAEDDAEPGQRFKPLSVKAAEALILKLQNRMDVVRGKAGKDQLLTFEQMGIDDLTVDEAHEFKNLTYSTKLTDVRGLGPAAGSQKAFDLYTKMRILHETNGSAVFLTGTPISNSAVEMYTIMRYLAPDVLRESGLEHFDAFRAQYVQATEKPEPTEAGDGLKVVNRLGRNWSNMRSLMDGYYSVADVVTNDDIKAWYAEDNPGKVFPLPNVKGGTRRSVVAKPTKTQQRLIDELIAGYNNLPNIEDVKQRNIDRLKLMDKARKLALHAKVWDRSLTDEPGGKLDMVVDESFRLYKEFADNKGTQLIFLDRSVPKAQGDDKQIKDYDALRAKLTEANANDDEDGQREAIEALEKFDSQEIDELRAAQAGGWNAYQHMADGLISKGVPKNQIAFIQNFTTDAQKKALFEAVNDGSIRFLFGSSQRMGAGMNVQERLVGLHHVDVTWKPSDIEQREGRIIRQGNTFFTEFTSDGKPNPEYRANFEVEIMAYVTERSIDAKMWDLNSTKLRMVNGIRYYDGEFEMDFDDDAAIDMAEIAAIASGDPLMLERIKVNTVIEELYRKRRSYNRRVESAGDSLRSAERDVETLPGKIAKTKALMGPIDKAIKEAKADQYARRVTVGGESFMFVETALKHAEEAIKVLKEGDSKKPFALDVDGESFTSEAGVQDAIAEKMGDVNSFVAEIDGKKVIRRTAVARELRRLIGTEFADVETTPVGTLFGFPFSMKAEKGPFGAYVTLTAKVPYEGGVEPISISYDLTPEKHKKGTPVPVLTSTLRAAVDSLVGKLDAASNDTYWLERMQRNLKEATANIPTYREAVKEQFKQADELDAALTRLDDIQDQLQARAAAAAATPAAPVADDAAAAFSRSSFSRPAFSRGAMTQANESVTRLANGIASHWENAPKIVVAFDMNDPIIPENVRKEDMRQRSGGATGTPEGFFYKGTVYLMSSKLGTPDDIARVLHHEALGHYGLRGLFGKALKPILREISMRRRAEVDAKIKQYGLKMGNKLDRFTAAEEVLAELAQTRPEIGIVQRAIAAIRTWLRKNVPGFKNMRLTDAEIIRSYILPARAYVENSGHRKYAIAMPLKNGEKATSVSPGFYVNGVRQKYDHEIDFNRSTTGVDDRIEPTFSRSIGDTLASAANSVRDGLTKATVTDLNRQFGNRLSDFRGLGLQTLGRRQLVDLYAGDLPQMEGYSRMVAQMDADKNESGAEADALATGWGKLKDERQLAELMHDATLAQIDPDKSYVTGDDQNFYDALRDGFDRLTPEAKAAYRKARDMYSGHNDKVREAIRERIMRSEMSSAKKQALLTKMEGEFFKKVKGVYFPLARFGQYVTIVKDSNGDVVSANRSETMNEAEATRKILIAKFPASGGWKVGKVLKDKEFNAARDGVGRGFMADLFETLDKTNAGDELTDAISQLYLAALPDLSWAKHGIHRKGTPGFSQDARRAFAQNMFHGARYLAKLRYADQLQVSLDDMQTHIANKADVDSFDSVKAQQVVDEMVKRHDSMMNPQTNPISTALTSFGFVFHLGLSPASALVNLSQTALVAYPVMGSKWGFGKASAALLDASRQAAGNKNDISKVLKGDELVAYNEAVRSGVIDVTMAHDLAGIAQGEDSKVSAKIRPVMKAASFLFHHAEKFNRQVTFVAAYRLSRDAGTGHQVAYEQAVKATYDGHFDYSASNRPRVMQGNVAKVVLLFKQYAQNMIYTLTRQAQLSLNAATPKERAEARKALSGLLVSHALAAGAFGLPMVGMLLGAASAIGGDDDEPWDAKVALQNMLADTLGQKPAEVLAHGLSRLTPWDISGRVGLDKLLLPDVQEGLQGSDAVKNWMASALGPVAGIAVNAGKGMQDIANGQYIRGMESMLPSALRSPLKAYRYGTEGNIDKTGVAINDEVSAAGVAGQALGFSPSETRLAQEGKSAIYSADRAIQERRSSLTRQFALAAMAKDQEGMADARKDIERFNEKNPKARITPVNLMQSVHARRKRIEQSEQGVYLPKKRQDAIDAGRFAVVD